MTFKITGEELGIHDCDFHASGETAGDVVRQVVDHLRDEHNVGMPDAEVILEGRTTEQPLAEADPGVVLVAERLISALNIVPSETNEIAPPPIPYMTNSTQ